MLNDVIGAHAFCNPHGNVVADTLELARRQAELLKAENVGELVAGRPHPLLGVRKGDFSVDVQGGDRLVFRSSHRPPSLNPMGPLTGSMCAP